MFKIEKQKDDRYSLECTVYNMDLHKEMFVYSLRNLTWEGIDGFIRGRLKNDDEVTWAHDIVRLTKFPAFITDNGELTTKITTISQ